LPHPAEFLGRLADGESLDEAQTYAAVSAILTEGWSDPEVAAFLSFLRRKGESADELVGAARSLLDNAVAIDPPAGPLFDCCGTGGDRAGTFNVSTATAFVAAACGLKVAKHGNRSLTSKSGSADVLQELGVNVDAPPDVAARCLDDCGIAFFFAPRWHPAVAKIQQVRRSLKFPTIFNLLGSLANPLRPTLKIVGVGGQSWQHPLAARMAQAIQRLGARSASVVVGEDGLDEITLTAATRVLRVTPESIHDEIWTPEDFGLPRQSGEGWKIAGPSDSAEIIRRLFADEQGPALDIVLANAAAALLTAGVVDDLRAGVSMATEAVASGGARAKLDALVRLTHS
jgi:anthranilate phosphoribosyltransferase